MHAGRTRVPIRAFALCLAMTAGAWTSGVACAPPEFQSYQREQSLAPEPAVRPENVMRIWMIHIGQGDALLIQLPARYPSTANGRTELIDVLVDGGPSGRQLLVFLRALYPEGTRLEHVVLTHHDSDHIKGLTALLKDDQFAVENIYHNGLASWAQGKKGFPANRAPSSKEAIFERGQGLGFLEADSSILRREYVMQDLRALRAAVSNAELAGVYLDFATAITGRTTSAQVAVFNRVYTNSDFIGARQRTPALPDGIRFESFWPRERPQRYGNWAYSINGNSATFRLAYGDFSMLFTGDHNDVSGEDLLDVFRTTGNLGRLRSEVLKVPHHGSHHNSKDFFTAVAPVISIASMGSQGFRAGWKHPSPKVIRWLGGTNHVYHTFIHERMFDYKRLNTRERNAMIEKKHILIETDGQWFRIVECEDPRHIPAIENVRRSDGTRWIKARR